MCFQAAPKTLLAALTVCSCISHKGITNLTLLQASEEKNRLHCYPLPNHMCQNKYGLGEVKRTEQSTDWHDGEEKKVHRTNDKN